MKQIGEQKFYTSQEVAELIGLTRTSVYKLYKNGRLQHVKVGTTCYVSERNLLRFLNGDTETEKED